MKKKSKSICLFVSVFACLFVSLNIRVLWQTETRTARQGGGTHVVVLRQGSEGRGGDMRPSSSLLCTSLLSLLLPELDSWDLRE